MTFINITLFLTLRDIKSIILNENIYEFKSYLPLELLKKATYQSEHVSIKNANYRKFIC